MTLRILLVEHSFSDRSPPKVTELGTSDKTLAELSSPPAMQELDGGKYLRSELDGVCRVPRIWDDPRVIGSQAKCLSEGVAASKTCSDRFTRAAVTSIGQTDVTNTHVPDC